MRLFSLHIYNIYILEILDFSSLFYPSLSTAGRSLTFFIRTFFFFYFCEGEIKEKMGHLEGLQCLGELRMTIFLRNGEEVAG